jgi:predicted HD phosphohydrolase
MLRRIQHLFHTRGSARYMISEPITQAQHARQCYQWMTQHPRSTPSLRVAALLHDVGHLLHDGDPLDPAAGVDDRHEWQGARWLAEQNFAEAVFVPVSLHVDAKRFRAGLPNAPVLSAGSKLSLALQGGPMSPVERALFLRHAFYHDAMLLRECDDAAKDTTDPATPGFNWDLVDEDLRLQHLKPTV